jgi:hypothetical protein
MVDKEDFADKGFAENEAFTDNEGFAESEAFVDEFAEHEDTAKGVGPVDGCNW